MMMAACAPAASPGTAVAGLSSAAVAAPADVLMSSPSGVSSSTSVHERLFARSGNVAARPGSVQLGHRLTAEDLNIGHLSPGQRCLPWPWAGRVMAGTGRVLESGRVEHDERGHDLDPAQRDEDGGVDG